MENNKTIHESFEEELANLSDQNPFNADFRKRKLIAWTIRTILLAILTVVFWEHDWVKTSLYFTIPLSLISLLMVFLVPYIIKRKIEKTKQRIANLDKLHSESYEEENADE